MCAVIAEMADLVFNTPTHRNLAYRTDSFHCICTFLEKFTQYFRSHTVTELERSMIYNPVHPSGLCVGNICKIYLKYKKYGKKIKTNKC